MIQLKMRAAMSAFALATLQACGGGGDSVVASSASFPISQALDSYVRDAKSSPVSITATVNGVPFAGSGTISESIATTTFEGVTAFQKAQPWPGRCWASVRAYPFHPQVRPTSMPISSRWARQIRLSIA
ncbi:hypothetical protein LP414_28835 [Polaromonas sp. P1(28)-13]|nr:hypothetical protein LP414_28835 [Polaromonas sp. P1(28)-13]